MSFDIKSLAFSKRYINKILQDQSVGKGEKGEPGKDGKSAYEIACENGYTGNVDQWLEHLKGSAGKDGITPQFTIGDITTLPSDSNAFVNITGTTLNPILNFGIPKGETGNYNVDIIGFSSDVKRIATYQGRDLTNIFTPAQLSSKIKKEDFQGIDIGDYFNITLESGEQAIIEVSGFNTYIMTGNSTLRNTNPHITITFRDCLETTYQMSKNSTNSGGYPATSLSSILNTTIFNLLPKAWRDIIIPTQRAELAKGNREFNTRYVWIPTEAEVFGRLCFGENTLDTALQLPIFSHSTRHLIKGLGKNAFKEQTVNWWLSSPDSFTTNKFCFVNKNGIAKADIPTTLCGIAPVFNIG